MFLTYLKSKMAKHAVWTQIFLFRLICTLSLEIKYGAEQRRRIKCKCNIPKHVKASSVL